MTVQTDQAKGPQTAAEVLLALAADWDERLCREHKVTGYTDWHSEEVRTLLAKHDEDTEARIEAEVQRRTAAAVSHLRWQIHAIRFAKEEGTLEGPDNFYNGVITAEAIARDHIPDPDPDQAGATSADTEALARIADLVAPAWRTNPGHQHDSTTEAYAAGRNEMIDAVREILADRNPRPRWMEGWLAAMDFLAEYKGADGIALAEEMSTRLPADVLARHQQEKP